MGFSRSERMKIGHQDLLAVQQGHVVSDGSTARRILVSEFEAVNSMRRLVRRLRKRCKKRSIGQMGMSSAMGPLFSLREQRRSTRVEMRNRPFAVRFARISEARRIKGP